MPAMQGWSGWPDDAWDGWGLAVASGVVLVDSPTRLSVMHVLAKTGDTIVFREILKGRDGAPQDLAGATVRFTLVAPDGVVKLVDRALATIVDAATGSVRYTVAASAGVPAGACSFEFEVTWPTGEVLTFPDNADGILTVRPELA